MRNLLQSNNKEYLEQVCTQVPLCQGKWGGGGGGGDVREPKRKQLGICTNPKLPQGSKVKTPSIDPFYKTTLQASFL